jgi:Tfp pilus assembly protein PilX
MKRQDGIALIATLLIMAAIMALGAGTLFLSDMNLRIAENSSTHATARYNAEAGLDGAIIQLTREYNAAKQFPSALTLPSSPTSEIVYQLVTPASQGYSTNTARTTATVRVLGSGPNNARYVAEAFMAIAINPAFLKGLTSQGNIRVSGGAAPSS